MLVTRLIPISIRTQHYELENVQYWQNLGQDLNFALFCSIMHYFLNQYQLKPLQRFLSINDKSLKEEFLQIHQQIMECLNATNPIKTFFQYLSKIKNNINQVGQLMKEYCRLHLLLKNDKPDLKNIALFLKIEISFLPTRDKYGQGLNEIILLENSNEYYFIVPSSQIRILPEYQCFNCNQKQNCIKINCQHQLCLICIEQQKKKSEQNFFDCNCGQIVLKNDFLEDAVQEILNIQKTNKYVTQIKEYYESITEEDQMSRELDIKEDFTVVKDRNTQNVKNDAQKQKDIQNTQQYQKFVSEGPTNKEKTRINQHETLNKFYGYQNKDIGETRNNNHLPQLNAAYSSFAQQRPQEAQQRYINAHFQEEKYQPLNLIGTQNISDRPQQIKESNQMYQSEACTYCKSLFNNYNQKQILSCQQHFIGVCCIFADYKNCPQCEKVNEKHQQNRSIKQQHKQASVIAQTSPYVGQRILRQNIIAGRPTMQAFYGNSLQMGQVPFDINYANLHFNEQACIYEAKFVRESSIYVYTSRK